MANRLLNIRQIRAEKLPKGRTWIFEAMRRGEFPRPVSVVGPNLWLESDIDAFVEKYIAEAKAAKCNDERRAA